MLAWQGKVRNCTNVPQHEPKVDFRCALIRHLEHNYLQRTLLCGSKKSLSNP